MKHVHVSSLTLEIRVTRKKDTQWIEREKIRGTVCTSVFISLTSFSIHWPCKYGFLLRIECFSQVFPSHSLFHSILFYSLSLSLSLFWTLTFEPSNEKRPNISWNCLFTVPNPFIFIRVLCYRIFCYCICFHWSQQARQ